MRAIDIPTIFWPCATDTLLIEMRHSPPYAIDMLRAPQERNQYDIPSRSILGVDAINALSTLKCYLDAINNAIGKNVRVSPN